MIRGFINSIDRKQSIIISITGIVIVSLMLIGLTYGYFLTTVQGNTNDTSISISTEKLELVYDDGTGAITAENLQPGVSFEKTFSVENTGNGTVVGYGVFLEDVISTFERTADLQLKISCSSSKYGDGYCNGYNGISPYQNDYLLQNSIEKGETHTYTLTLEYVEAGVDQSVDMGKVYSGRIQIYSTAETVDFAGTFGKTAPRYLEGGEYVVIRNNVTGIEKKTYVRNDLTFKVVGLLSGNYSFEIYSKDGATLIKSKEFNILKGTGSSSSRDIYVTDLSRTIVIGEAVIGGTVAFLDITVSDELPLQSNSFGATILANGATYVSSWVEGKSYYRGHECGTVADCTNLGFKEFTYYEPSATINEKILKTDDSYGSSKDDGLFMAEDDYGITYYFKGAIVNNYVEFAGLDWRIVRINGDGSVRLILADTTKNLGVGEDSVYVTDAYNYLAMGYMYGEGNSGSYIDGQKNINDSVIKDAVDLFYETYLKDVYGGYISDTLFCSDKSLDKALPNEYVGSSSSEQIYYHFGSSTSFKCAEGANNTYSRYTSNSVATNKGVLVNNDLDYPIGLLSSAEYSMAGGSGFAKNSVNVGVLNNKNYLITDNFVNAYISLNKVDLIYNTNSSLVAKAFWLMSPHSYELYCSDSEWATGTNTYYNYSNCNIFGSTRYYGVFVGYGDVTLLSPSSLSGVRPVINIKPHISVISGDGTIDNPYVI